MFKRFLILCLFLVVIVPTYSAYDTETYSLTLNQSTTPDIGAENIFTLHSALSNALDGIITIDEGSVLRLPIRLARLVLVDYFFASYAYLAQHEVFGHGFRAREEGVYEFGYKLNPPFPYGDGTGSAPVPLVSSYDGTMMISNAGSEANSVLVKRLGARWLKSDVVDYREGLMFWMANLDRYYYIDQTTSDDFSESSHDVGNFINNISAKYGINKEDYLKKIQDENEWNQFNIMLAPAYYSVFNYLILGNKKTEGFFEFYPGLFGIKLLPYLRLELSPFGMEHYVETFIKTDNGVSSIYFRYGDEDLEKDNYGIGYRKYNSELSLFGASNIEYGVDIWNQPSYEYYEQASVIATDNDESSGGLGASVDITLFYDKLLFQLGYKTDGFLQGYEMDATIRFGAGYIF